MLNETVHFNILVFLIAIGLCNLTFVFCYFYELAVLEKQDKGDAMERKKAPSIDQQKDFYESWLKNLEEHQKSKSTR